MDELLKAQLFSYYRDRFPGDVDMAVEQLTQLTHGWYSDVYDFSLRYSQDGQNDIENRILKSYTPDVEGADRALRERHALNELHAAGYPVPRPSVVEVEKSPLGRPFVVMERIEGQTLWDALQTADETRRQRLLKLFVGLMIDLHGLPLRTLVNNIEVKTLYSIVRRELLNIRQLIARLEQPIFDPVYEWLHARYESVPCHHPAITHRDFTPWNVLLTSQDWRSYAAYVIDWNWQISDPRYDLAWTLTTLDRGGHTQLRADILSEYERQTEGAVEQLAFYEVLVSLRWVLNVRAALHANNPADDVRMLLLPSVKQALTLIQQHTDIMLPDASAVVMG